MISVAVYTPVIDMLTRVLDSEARATGGSALLDLRARALALRGPPKSPRTHRERRATAVAHEVTVWGEDLQGLLVASQASQVVDHLLKGQEPGEDGSVNGARLWSRLDPGEREGAESRERAEVDRVDQVVRTAIATYVVTKKVTPLRGAVRELELAIRRPLETTPVGDEDTEVHSNHLNAALQALPAQARSVFVKHVRSHVEEARESVWLPDPTGEHWLSRESWTRWSSRTWDPGPFFIGDLQARYDLERDQAIRLAEASAVTEREFRARLAADSEMKTAPQEEVAEATVNTPPPRLSGRPRRTLWTPDDPPTPEDYAAMDPSTAASIKEGIAFQTRHDDERRRREQEKEEYEHQLRSR